MHEQEQEMQGMEALYRKALPLVQGGASRRRLMDELRIKSWKAQQLIVMCRAALAGSMQDAVDFKSPIFRGLLVRKLRRPQQPAALAAALRVSEDQILAAVQDLEGSGYCVHRKAGTVFIGKLNTQPYTPITLKEQLRHEHVFGFVADSHLCSRHERLDVLNAAYDTFAAQGITTVFHGGNMVDGEAKFNTHELLAHGVTDQTHYCLDHYPQRPGVTTYYVDADDHEGWWQQREGIEFGRQLQLEAEQRGRHDLQYMGYMENDVLIEAPQGRTVIKVVHAGGGSSYALSYTSQKLVESLQGGEKPHILLIGHYHKAEYCYPRNVHCLQGGCTQDQTRFMRKKRLDAHVGFWVVRFTTDDLGGVSRFAPEFYAFFDRRYYEKRKDIGV